MQATALGQDAVCRRRESGPVGYRGDPSKDPERPCFRHGSRPVLDFELAVDVVQLPLESALRHKNRLRDLLVREARLQTLEDRDSTLGELLTDGRRGLWRCAVPPARRLSARTPVEAEWAGAVNQQQQKTSGDR
jgi:hypothetical protein